MDTTTIADSGLELQPISSFFQALGAELPEELTVESLRGFKLAQDQHWAEALQEYQQLRTAWSKERLKLDQLIAAKEQKPKAIEAQAAVEEELHARFQAGLRPLLEARGREEVARLLPAALTDAAAARFVRKQLEIAVCYLLRTRR